MLNEESRQRYTDPFLTRPDNSIRPVRLTTRQHLFSKFCGNLVHKTGMPVFMRGVAPHTKKGRPLRFFTMDKMVFTTPMGSFRQTGGNNPKEGNGRWTRCRHERVSTRRWRDSL